jgi:hypothetical protein
MQMDESDEQCENAEVSMRESREPASKPTVPRDAHERKQSEGIVSTREGMHIDESDEHSRNAEGSIQESSEPGSNVMVARQRHPMKDPWAILLTEEGIEIDASDAEYQNAILPINETADLDSKLTLRIEDPPKHPAPRDLMVFGITTSIASPKHH